MELEALLEKGGKTEYLNQIKSIADMVEVVAVRQKEAKGLGHAVLCAKSFVGDEPFAVLLGDDVVYNDGTPCLKQLIDVYNEKGGSVLGVQTVPHENICKYGCVDGEKLGDRLYSVKDVIQLTDALKALAKEQAMYAYDFVGRRYDVGDRLGFLEATVEYALRREDLSGQFKSYLKGLEL